MDRITVAYLLISLLALALAVGIGLRVYGSPERTVRRRRRSAKARRGDAWSNL